jgi:hypothetical protein
MEENDGQKRMSYTHYIPLLIVRVLDKDMSDTVCLPASPPPRLLTADMDETGEADGAKHDETQSPYDQDVFGIPTLFAYESPLRPSNA